MKTKLITALIFSFICISYAQQLPKVSSGKLMRIEKFKSVYVKDRNVDVWLPDNYSSGKKYSVVYMHDGQMLFDSTCTWNNKEWKVDEVFGQLMKEEKIGNCIVVGIWNSGSERISEYFPNKIFSLLDKKTKVKLFRKYCNGKPVNGDNYLKFVVKELKPYIDKKFSTLAGTAHTYMIGSSMGGLISLYAQSEYPSVFGGVACLSTAWFSSVEPNFAIPTACFEYLKKNLAPAENHKIYMDYGSAESDGNYALTHSFVDLIVRSNAYTDANYLFKVYEKGIHDENSWSKRLNVPLEFLIKKALP